MTCERHRMTNTTTQPHSSRQRRTSQVTDDDILALEAVPVETAARYLGWSERNVRDCLREGRAPFGVAFRAESQVVFKILPEPLVRFKHQGLQPEPFSAWTRLISAIVQEAVEPLRKERER